MSHIGPSQHLRGANSLIQEKVADVNFKTPEIVFFGTSVCQEGVDESLLFAQSALRSAKYCGHIQRSAYYYLFLKNVILSKKVKKKPSFIAILFVYGTLTEIRQSLNHGEEFYINSLSVKEDDLLLDKLLYQGDDRLLVRIAKGVSFFLKKSEIYKQYLFKKVEERMPAKVALWQSDANQLLQRKNMLPKLYESEVEKVIGRSSDQHLATFNDHVGKTFLPHIVDQEYQ